MWTRKNEKTFQEMRAALGEAEVRRNEAIANLEQLLDGFGVFAASAPPPWGAKPTARALAERLVSHADGLRDMLEPFDSGVRAALCTQAPPAPAKDEEFPW